MSALRQNTPEWIEARRLTVGSSDIPIIIGESPHKSAHTLGAEKLGLIPATVDPETQKLFDIGHILQPALLAIYEVETGRHAVPETGWRRHPEVEWATASLDGHHPARRPNLVVEAKWSNSLRWGTDERVPGDVNAQVQWQLFVTGWRSADVVVLYHGVPRVETIARDDTFIDNLVWFAQEFMGRLAHGELPPVDGSESTQATLRKRYPRDDGTMLPATPDLVDLVGQFRDAKAESKAAAEAESSIGNALRAILGDASGIDGLCTYRKNADSTRVNWPAVAEAYRALLEPSDELDAIVSLHSTTSEGPRVLRLSKGAAA